MSHTVSILLRADAASVPAALTLAERLKSSAQVFLAGAGSATRLDGVTHLEAGPGAGDALRAALAQASTPITLIIDADARLAEADWELSALTSPIVGDTADIVVARRSGLQRGARRVNQLAHAALSRFARMVADVELHEPLSSVRAYRTEVLRKITFGDNGSDGLDAEILVKLAAQRFRFAEVEIPVGPTEGRDTLASARTLLRYATLSNDTDNQHEGYNTLARMEEAPNYNAWIGRRVRAHLGRRVLEIGAGIGTITREIESACELLIALEVDGFYVDRLKNLFRGKPHVRPYLSDVALADWESLAREQIDTIVLSNVLEHIEDDAGALRRFRQILAPGGKVIVLVPALMQLYGSIDEAVGHHRRYTKKTLAAAFEAAGFDVETLEWMNLVGAPGWFLNNRIFKRRAVPRLQLKLYDAIAPLLADLESRVSLPIGMSLFAVAKAR